MKIVLITSNAQINNETRSLSSDLMLNILQKINDERENNLKTSTPLDFEAEESDISIKNYYTRSNPCGSSPCHNGGSCQYPITTDFPPTTVPPEQLEQLCEDADPLEVVFVLDGSGSVGSSNFNTQLTFLQQLTAAMNIGPDKTRVGLLHYTHNAWVEFNFLDNPTSVQNEIDAIYYRGRWGGTNTGEAIEKAYDRIIKDRTRAGATVIMIVVTDGESRDEVTDASNNMRGHGITMFAVGYAGANVAELETIANDPDTEHVFVGETASDLLAMVNSLTEMVCTTVPGNGVNFACDCPYLYTGELCETFVLPCEYSDTNNGNPCLNGAVCENINGNTEYSCTCAAGYTHSNCETVIPCFSSPCQNSGNCTDINDFSVKPIFHAFPDLVITMALVKMKIIFQVLIVIAHWDGSEIPVMNFFPAN